MEQRTLGRTGLPISTIGFGAWEIGGLGVAQGSMGPADDAESLAAIERALDHGVNWIDTAPGYGLGHSEEVVGQAIKHLHEKPLVFTKCGFVWDDDGHVRVCLTPGSLRAESERSLRRLGVEAIDLYQIHWLEPEDDPFVEEAWSTLAELKREGKVRHIGVSNFNVDQIRRAEAIAPVETLQPPYSLLDRSAEADLLPYCARAEIGVVVYSPLQSGLLTGAWSRERVAALPERDARRFDPNFEEPLLTRNLDFVEQLKRVAARRSTLPGQLAVAWTLGHRAVHGAIVGFRRPAQVDGILAGFEEFDLTDDELRELELEPAALA